MKDKLYFLWNEIIGPVLFTIIMFLIMFGAAYLGGTRFSK